MLHGLESIDRFIVQLEIEGFHRSGDIQDQFNGNAFTAYTRLRFTRLGSGQPNEDQAQASCKNQWHPSIDSLHPSDRQSLHLRDAGIEHRRSICSSRKVPKHCEDHRQQAKPIPGKETKGIHRLHPLPGSVCLFVDAVGN